MRKIAMLQGTSFLLAIMIFVPGCKKKNNETTVTGTIPVVLTVQIINPSINSVDITGNVTNDGGIIMTKRGFCWSNTNQNPTIYNDTIASGLGGGAFSGTVKGLKGQTTYYIRAYATNNIGTGYGNTLDFKTIDTTITDIDNNHYRIVQVGSQVWMSENLKSVHYRNGDIIPEVTVSAQWGNLTTGAMCWYNNDPSTYRNTYGAMYNWYAITDNRILSPAGWHIPSDAEWLILIDVLGGESVAGGKMKEKGTAHWMSPNTGADNSSNISALPGGFRHSNGTFFSIGTDGYWWSATESTPGIAFNHNLNYLGTADKHLLSNTIYGFNIRCIRD